MSCTPPLLGVSARSIKSEKIFDTGPLIFRRIPEKIRVKSIEPNISKHENGTFYFVARRKGKLTVKSLQTKDLAEARRKIREIGTIGLSTAREPGPPLACRSVPLRTATVEVKPTAPVMALEEALAAHDSGLVLLSAGTREMAARGKRAIARFATGWANFEPVRIWSEYRATGIGRQGKELGSAANHLRWYLMKFVPWSVKRGFLGEDALESLAKIPRLKVNPRRIRVPSAAVVGEFLAMVESEDADGGAYLRFLTSTGLRRSGAADLAWSDIDFAEGTMAVTQKGGRKKVIPMTPEAVAVLRGRHGLPRPWAMDIKAIERLERRMKRFAKGLGIDLTTFHAFRHYFASRCLLAGLTVQEVATLLGHSDGGVLVLQTYGHICGAHLRQAVAGLRLAS